MRNLDEILKTRNLKIKAIERNMPMVGGSYYDTISGKWLNFMFSVQMGWEHLSVSMPSKTPSWDQMCVMKDIFFEEEEECFEYHPKKSEYVNMHPHCLHIWRPRVEDRINAFSQLGFIKPYKVNVLEVLKDFNMSEEQKEAMDKFLSAEGSSEKVDELTITLADKVPLELLDIVKPPSILVGTKNTESFNAFKDVAKSFGKEVNPSSIYVDGVKNE
ncbi:MAG: hypothetical protein J6T15_04885 [Bacilli bacterium]|nr:hypothetical protein [Bacilli bacterium]